MDAILILFGCVGVVLIPLRCHRWHPDHPPMDAITRRRRTPHCKKLLKARAVET